ncbi:MAG: phosphoglycerate dehydrogenase [Phycisphaerales bacterium]|nr:phosphoglycerate dehydrogenase [Phycisphaerales bacterium]
MQPVAVLAESIHLNADRALEEAGLKVERVPGALEGAALREAIARAAVIGIRSKTQLGAEVFRCGPLPAAIGCFCIGTNQVALRPAARAGVAVFNSPFSNTRSVAEMTVSEVVALVRRLFEKSSQMHRGHWDKSARDAHELRGRTLGIIGYGHIGSQVSVLAESLGMRVVFHDIARRMPLGNATSRTSLDAVLKESDVVTIHVPSTAATEGMIATEQLARMRPGAVLVNNARGSVVDLEALAAAIRRGHIGGAAIDVFPEEPSGSSETFFSPLQGLPNVILTPHIGGSTEEAQEAIAVEVSEKLAAFHLRGSTATSVNMPEVELPSPRDGQVRLMHVHRNVPGVLGKMHTILAASGVNINAEYLQSDSEVSYVILDVDPFAAEDILPKLEQMPETIRLRVRS